MPNRRQRRSWFRAISGFLIRRPIRPSARPEKFRGRKALNRLQAAAAAHILPSLGEVELHRLTRRGLENWLDALAEAPARLRIRPGLKQRHRERDSTGDGRRRRKATANRVLTVLKGALNLALRNRHVASGEAWQTVKPYREANAPKIRYLSDDESQRLVNACPPEFRALVTAALLTGCRYGELAVMTAGDFSRDAGAVHVPVTRSSKARHVYLTDEGRSFFDRAAVGKAAGDLLFSRADGKPWGSPVPADA